MRERRKVFTQVIVLILVGIHSTVAAWGFGSDSILLKDIEVLTLYTGKMTAGGRSSPVPQLECVSGGTAPCNAFQPRVVQCYNRGYDGTDVQWECKSDMDNAYRFGEIEVSCEGYSHKDDPYVLRGSCGLRYSLDYTKEGLNQQKGHNYYGSDNYGFSYSGSSGNGNSYQTYKSSKLSWASTLSDIIVFVAAALMMWAFYKTCCGSSRHAGQDAYSSTSDDYPAGGGGGGGGGPGYGWFGQGGNNQHGNYPGGNYADGNASCRNRGANAGGGGAGGAGGFWTGAAAGGLLGYMFGNRGNQHYQNYGYGGYHQPRRAGGLFGGGGGGGGWTTGGGGGGWGGGGSTGTRTASGFGGTSRR
ncbi:store-operated calcium entry-associated regulatory factor-like [Palaemon carinicauda]|uniref:store-operated calcium entry-associated regulatory factor-like n=1 Tax=Palaemon carinicauda TaxID=392227 RepID=UPI0035B57450